jgi:Uma2 family endonuclease
MTLWDTRPMSDQPLDLTRTWTEDEYLALGELDIRTELIDWKIVVSPKPNRPHQGIAFYLLTALNPVARAAGYKSFLDVDVRLRPGDIVAPDIAIGTLPWEPGVAEATDVILVAEVTSPSNHSSDRRTKKKQYESARIPFYLLVEPDMSDYRAVALHLFRLDGTHYVEHAFARHGQSLMSDEPFPIDVDTRRLIRP